MDVVDSFDFDDFLDCLDLWCVLAFLGLLDFLSSAQRLMGRPATSKTAEGFQSGA